MDCPVCQNAFIVVEREGIELDYCIHCQGVWFDAGELELLFESLPPSVTRPDWTAFQKVQSTEKSYPCPRCRQKMEKIHIGDPHPVTVDRCPQGEGLWFDQGELLEVIKLHHVPADNPAHGDQSIETSYVLHFIGDTLSL